MYKILFYNTHNTLPIFASPPFTLSEGGTEEYLASVLQTICKQGFIIFDENVAIMSGSFASAKIVLATDSYTPQLPEYKHTVYTERKLGI